MTKHRMARLHREFRDCSEERQSEIRVEYRRLHTDLTMMGEG